MIQHQKQQEHQSPQKASQVVQQSQVLQQNQVVQQSQVLSSQTQYIQSQQPSTQTMSMQQLQQQHRPQAISLLQQPQVNSGQAADECIQGRRSLRVRGSMDPKYNMVLLVPVKPTRTREIMFYHKYSTNSRPCVRPVGP
jgi:hypothetical protein